VLQYAKLVWIGGKAISAPETLLLEFIDVGLKWNTLDGIREKMERERGKREKEKEKILPVIG